MKNNIYKKVTFEDKFARKYFCTHARLNSIRNDKRFNKRKFRRIIKSECRNNE